MSIHVVTGGAGFIGSHLVAALLQRGDRVRVVDDLSTGRVENLAELEVGEPGSGAPVELYRGDVSRGGLLDDAFRGAEAVFHQAAQVSVPQSLNDPERSYAVNVTGTLRVLEAARKAKVSRVLFAASSAAYGNSAALPKTEDITPVPLSPYASGKVAGEHLMSVWGACFGLRTVCLRYFNIFGPRQADDSPYTGVIAIFARALLEGERPIIYGDGEQTRDFTYVDNVVSANLLALEQEVEPGAVYNVGTAEQVSINALFERMAELLGSDLRPIHRPERAGDVRHSRAGLDRIRRELGYEPRVGWREGLKHTVEWYRRRASAGLVADPDPG